MASRPASISAVGLAVLCAAAGALLLAAVPTAAARTILLQPDGSGDYPTIQAAVDASLDGDVIELGNGTYAGPGNRDVVCDGRSITIRSLGNDPMLCTIDCEGSEVEPHRGFDIRLAGSLTCRVTLQGLTIQRGYAAGEGGAVLLRVREGAGGTLTAEGCVFRDCSASAGGAICGTSDTGWEQYDISVRDCRMENNSARGAGGGMALFGSFASLSALECEFLENGAGFGGAIWTGQYALDAVRDCSFTRNSATNYGGAVVVSFDSYPSYVNCVFEANTAGVGGGAIAVEPSAKADRPRRGDKKFSSSNCRFLRNSAPKGGAIFAAPGGAAAHDFSGCLFQENSAEDGGAVYETGETWLLSFTGCVFDRNTADRGGAVFATGMRDAPDEAAPSYRQCTFARNGAGAGGTIFVGVPDGGSLGLASSIIALSLQGGAVHCESPASILLECCDLFGNEGGDWVGAIADQVNVGGNFSADPCFCDPGAGTYTLSADSWCLPGHLPWGCESLVGALGEGCPEAGCAGVVPVVVSDFAARVAADGIAISWRLNAPVEAARLRVRGTTASGGEWTVPFKAGAGGAFSAVDRQGLQVLRSARNASLAYALELSAGGDWTLLGRQEIAAADFPKLAPLALEVAPNPFNPTTTIRFGLPAAGPARLMVYDVAGQLVRTLVDAELSSGSHEAVWDGRDAEGRAMASGGYLARLEAGGKVETARLGLVR